MTKAKHILNLKTQPARSASHLAIYLTDDEICRFCLLLALLREGLINELYIVFHETEFQLIINSSPLINNSDRAIIENQVDNSFKIGVTPVELDYWYIFFLKYCRDGYGDVNHIDVELFCKDNDSLQTVCFRVEKTGPLISEDELRRRLELN